MSKDYKRHTVALHPSQRQVTGNKVQLKWTQHILFYLKVLVFSSQFLQCSLHVIEFSAQLSGLLPQFVILRFTRQTSEINPKACMPASVKPAGTGEALMESLC